MKYVTEHGKRVMNNRAFSGFFPKGATEDEIYNALLRLQGSQNAFGGPYRTVLYVLRKNKEDEALNNGII